MLYVANMFNVVVFNHYHHGNLSLNLQTRRYRTRPLSRLAVNFTAGLAFSRLRSRLSRNFRGDGGLAFSLRSCSFVQFSYYCYVFAFLTFSSFCQRFPCLKKRLGLPKILSRTSRSTLETITETTL